MARYRFAGFTFDSDRCELLDPAGNTVELQPKVEGVLVMLLENVGRTVSKDELLDRVWHDVATTEGSLARAVHLARRAVEWDGADPIIRTVRGRGYRIDVPVEQLESADDSQAVEEVEPSRVLPAGKIAVFASLLLVPILVVGALARPIDLPELATAIEPPAPVSPPTAIAVLRFQDLSPRGDQQYFAEGIAEETIHRLAQIPGLRVSGRASSFSMSEDDLAIAEIGELLNAGSVLTGSVRIQDQDVRITAQLVRARDEALLWSEAFDRHVDDVLDVQDEIAIATASALTDVIAGVDPVRAERHHRPSPSAYDHFLRGCYAQKSRSRESLDAAVGHFERAIAIDSQFADAHAELARSLANFAYHVRDDPAHTRALLDRADEMARRALTLDAESGPAHVAMAGVHRRRLDLEGAERELRRALALAPGYAAAHEELGATLAKLGRLEDSRDEFLRLLELDPLSPLAHRQVGRIYLYLGEHDRATPHLVRSLELNPNEDDAPRLLTSAYFDQGRELEAGEIQIRQYPVYLRPAARFGLRVIGLRAMVGLHHDVLEWLTEEPCLGRAYDAAGMLAAARRPEEMFACLERARPNSLSYFGVEPVFAPYREDPRFRALLARSGRPVPPKREPREQAAVSR